jgi:hypothetical protein
VRLPTQGAISGQRRAEEGEAIQTFSQEAKGEDAAGAPRRREGKGERGTEAEGERGSCSVGKFKRRPKPAFKRLATREAAGEEMGVRANPSVGERGSECSNSAGAENAACGHA